MKSLSERKKNGREKNLNNSGVMLLALDVC